MKLDIGQRCGFPAISPSFCLLGSWELVVVGGARGGSWLTEAGAKTVGSGREVRPYWLEAWDYVPAMKTASEAP